MQVDPGMEPQHQGTSALVLENERVRVIEYRDEPGDRTEQHHHSDYLLVALSAFRRQLTLQDGSVSTRSFEPGDVVWMHAQRHVAENVGETGTHLMIVELKERPGRSH